MNGRPLCIVEDSGFKKIISPILETIERNTGAKPALNRKNINDIIQYKNAVKETIVKEMEGKMVCLKLDIASKKFKSLLGINVQYVQDNAIKIRTLAMRPVTVKHTSDIIFAIIQDVLQDFGVDLKQIFTVTTDNGANLLKTARIMQKYDNLVEDDTSDGDSGDDEDDESLEEDLNFDEYEEYEKEMYEKMNNIVKEFKNKSGDADFLFGVICVCHNLQLAICHAVAKCSGTKALIAKCRKLVKKLRTLKFSQLIKRKGLKRPVLGCCTRWSSLYEMVSYLFFH